MDASGNKFRSHTDLIVYRKAMAAAQEIYQATKKFPKEETYPLTDQVRRSSRSVCANLADAWRRRRYIAAFINKLNEVEAEAAETQVWIEFAVKCGYLDRELGATLFKTYDEVLRTIVGMIRHPETWIIHAK